MIMELLTGRAKLVDSSELYCMREELTRLREIKRLSFKFMKNVGLNPTLFSCGEFSEIITLEESNEITPDEVNIRDNPLQRAAFDLLRFGVPR